MASAAFLAALLVGPLQVSMPAGIADRPADLPPRASGPQAHLEAVVAERHEALERRLVELDASLVERTLARTGIAPLSWPDRRRLDRLRRELDAFDGGGSVGQLERLVDDLDLRVVPGVWTAADDRGPVLRVRVAPLAPVDCPPQVGLSLVWVAPDGGRSVARQIAVDRAALVDPGFDAWVRAPLGAGFRELVVELDHGGEVARSAPIRLEAVERFDQRLADLDREGFSPAQRHWYSQLQAAVTEGHRSSDGLPASTLLEALEGGSDAHLPAPIGGPRGPLAMGDPRGKGPVVVVLCAPGEAPGGLFRGARGDAWRAALAEHGATLVPLAADSGEVDIEALVAAFPGRALVVLPRPARLFELLDRAEAWAERGVLFLFQAVGPLAPFEGRLPGAVVGLDALPSGAQSVALGGSRVPLLAEAELGRRFAEWWRTR